MIIPALALLFIFFLIPRLPWFTNYPIAILNPDSFGYLSIAWDILSSKLPDFSVRFPVYPLFLAAILHAAASLKAVIVIQNVFILLCACVFLWAIKKTYPKMILLGALVIALQIGQPNLVAHGFTILTETVFSGMIILFSACLVMSIGGNKPIYFVWASIAAALAYLIHIRGIFLFTLFPIIALYIYFNSIPKKYIIYAVIPLLIGVMLVPAYQTLRSKVIPGTYVDDLKNYHIYCLTSSFWEADNQYPDKVNQDIVHFKATRTPDDRKIITESWDADVLYTVIFDNYQEINQWENPRSINVYLNSELNLDAHQRDVLGGQIAHKAISTHPDIFLKFIWTSFRKFLSGWVWSPLGVFYQYYPTYLDKSYLPDGSLQDKTLFWAFWDYSQLPEMPALPVIGKKENRHYGFIPSIAFRINEQFSQIIGVIFAHVAWFYAFLLAWAASLVLTIVSRLRHRDAFLLFSFGFLLFVMALIIPLSLTSYASSRYSIPTHYFQYLIVFFSPLLFKKQSHAAL